MKEIKTNNAPSAIGPYSQGIIMGDLVFTSGQIPLNPETNEIPEGIEAQTHQALSNLKGVLEGAGAGTENVIKTTLFIKNMDDFSKINEIYAGYFKEPYPARSCVEVAKLPKGVLIEIEAVAKEGKK